VEGRERLTASWYKKNEPGVTPGLFFFGGEMNAYEMGIAGLMKEKEDLEELTKKLEDEQCEKMAQDAWAMGEIMGASFAQAVNPVATIKDLDERIPTEERIAEIAREQMASLLAINEEALRILRSLHNEGRNLKADQQHARLGTAITILEALSVKEEAEEKDEVYPED
jgi:hypothetical protein